MLLTDTGRAPLAFHRGWTRARLFPLLASLSLLIPAATAAPKAAVVKARPTLGAPPMNSVHGLSRYIGRLKANAQHDEHKEAKADKDAGLERDHDQDRDRKEHPQEDKDKEHDDDDAPRRAAAVKARALAGVKAAHLPTGASVHTTSAVKPRKIEKPGDDEDEDGTDYLEAYLYTLQQRAYPNDGIDQSAYARAVKQRDQMAPAPFASPGRYRPQTPSNYERWEFVGPRDLAVPYRIYYGTQVLSGRVNGLAFDPTNSGTYYLASASGGAWKTKDGGSTWTPLSDTWTAMQCSTVTLDPTNSDIVYIGTGDYDGQNGAGGFGIMKSTDGGLSWTQLGSELGQGRVSALIVDPSNPNIVTLTTGRSYPQNQYSGHIWRSVNGGQNWSNVSGTGSDWSDLVYGAPDANGRRYYYACGNDSGHDHLWRSADQGATWTHLTAPAVNSDSLPRLTASQSDPNTVYFGSSNDNKIYKSLDAGATFADTTGNLPGGSNWSQSFYDFRLTATTFTNASGNAAEAVYASLIDLDQSIDAGADWQALGMSYQNTSILHNDQHALAINPTNPNDVLVGCDGGAYHLTYQPSNNTWSFATMNGALGTTLFYHGAWSPTDPDQMLGGTQDNATPQSSGNLGQWNNRGGGDGGDAAIDPTNTNNQYATSQYIEIYHTSNNWANVDYPASLTQRSASGDEYNGEARGFIGPITLDPTNTHLLYVGTDHLWRYDDRTQAWAADLGNQQLAGSGGTLSSVAVAPTDSNRLYTGSSNGQVWTSGDAGATWTQINAGVTSLPNRNITAIDVNPSNPLDVLVGLSGTGSGHLWRCVDTTAGGALTWVNLSGTGASALPDISLNSVTRDLDDTQATFYVATDVGVFYTADGGVTWTNATEPLGLPNVQVNEIRAIPGTRFLNVATFGRGMWRIKLPSTTGGSGLAITSLQPTSASARGPAFSLSITGTGFTTGSQALWNDSTRTTHFVSSTNLTADIPASDITTAGTANVTVRNSPTDISNALDFTISDNAPTTTASLAGPIGTNGWYTGDVTVTLTATSPGGPSNIAATYYTLDGGAQQTYTAPFVVTGEGIHALTFWSVDVMGHEETPHQSLAVRIDSVAPTLTFGTPRPAPNAAGWNDTPVALPYATADATSGVASASPGSPLTFAAEGQAQTQAVTVTDVAGNSQAFLSPPVSVDLTPPVTAAAEADTNAGAQVTLTATDALSGVASTFYAVDGAEKPYTGPVTVATAGSHTFTYWSIDVAGNEEAHHPLSLSVNPAPFLTALAPATVKEAGPDLTLRVTGSGFLAASVVQWNGAALATTFVSAAEVDAVVPAASTAAPGQDAVTVLNPVPGGGASNALPFLVTDANTPVTTLTLAGPGAQGRYRGDVTATLTATDADGAADLAGTFYTLDGTAVQTYSGPIRITGVGTHTLTYWSTDRSGNEETHHAQSLVIDTTAPVTTATAAGPSGSAGWYSGPVTVTLAAADPDGVADVASTYYTLDGGARQAYTAPLIVTGEGSHTVTFWSTDIAGNEETPHPSLVVRIDGTAPTLTFGTPTPAPTRYGWNNTAVSVPYAAADATSGVAKAAPGSPVRFSAAGQNQKQTVTVTDVAGNGAAFTTPAVSIDLTPPVTAGVLSGGVLTLTATDDLSGVASTFYALDGGAQQAYTAPVTLPGGAHTVVYGSVDRAGNAEAPHTLSAGVAVTGPAVLHTFPAGVQMFSVPRDMGGIALKTALDFPPAALFVWDPTLVNYVMSPSAPADALRPGGAYWARFPQAARLFDMGKATATGGPFGIALRKGWNMIGDPFESGVTVSTIVVQDGGGRSYDIGAAAQAGLIGYNLYSYPAGSSAYTVQTVPGGTLDTYLGYWVYANAPLTLLVPPPTNRVPL